VRLAIVVAVAGAIVSSGWATPDAYADPGQDQRFLDLVRSNGVAQGEPQTLLDYAGEFCRSTGVTDVLPSRPILYDQGVIPVQLYIVRMLASRVYCPDKIVTPPGNAFQ
jgi:hypothetical protein